MTNSIALASVLAADIVSAQLAQIKSDSKQHKKLSVLFRELGELCATDSLCPIQTERELNALRMDKISTLKASEAHPVAVSNCHKAYNHAIKEYFCKAYNQAQDDVDSDKAIYYYAVSKGHDACIWFSPKVEVCKPQKDKKQLSAAGTANDDASESASALNPNAPRTLLDQADDARSFLAALSSGLDSGMLSPDDVLAVVANHQALARAKAVVSKVKARSVPVRKEIALLEKVVTSDKQESAQGAALGAIGKAA